MRNHTKVCKTCHKNKKQNLKYGKLTANYMEAIPWYILSVDLIDTYKTRGEVHDKPFILKYLTIIDPETG